MGRVSENERDFKAQSYFRLLRYARPYWLRLTIGILAGMTVGGSLFVSLLMIPQLVGVVDPAGAGSAVETKAAPSRLTGEILRALEKPGLTEAEKAAAIEAVVNPQEEDPQLAKILRQAQETAERYHLPYRVEGGKIQVY